MTIIPDNDRIFNVLFDNEEELITFEKSTLNKSITFFQFNRDWEYHTWYGKPKITCIIRAEYYLDDCINEINKLKL